MPEQPKLPASIETFVLEPGHTPIHNHPAAQEIAELVALLRLDVKDGGKSVNEVRDILVIEWPDLAITEKQLNSFMVDYVDPNIVVAPAYYKRGMMKANAKLNAAAAIAETAERMHKKWEDDEKNVGKVIDYDSDGNPIMGPTTLDWLKGGKHVIEARRQQMDEMARIGMAPERKGGGGGATVNVITPTQVNVNLREAVGASGRKPADVVDADFKDKPARPT